MRVARRLPPHHRSKTVHSQSPYGAGPRRGVEFSSGQGAHLGRGGPVGRAVRDPGQCQSDMLRAEAVQPRRRLALPCCERGLTLRAVRLRHLSDDAWQRLGEAVPLPSLRGAPPPLSALAFAAVPAGANHGRALVSPIGARWMIHKLKRATSTLGDIGYVFD